MDGVEGASKIGEGQAASVRGDGVSAGVGFETIDRTDLVREGGIDAADLGDPTAEGDVASARSPGFGQSVFKLFLSVVDRA